MEEDKNEFEEKEELVIAGQIGYDEFLSEILQEEKEEVVENVVLDGQINFDELENNNIIENNEIIKANETQKSNLDFEKSNEKPTEKENLIENKLQVENLNQNKNKKILDEIQSAINQENINEEKTKTGERKMKKQKQLELGTTTIYKSLDDVLHESMIPYTEHVVLDRALPRVEDGLKPVQRRILYSMLELGVTPDKQFRKSARIVGDCMGKYHPHGDSSVYDAMVRMAQNFSLREPLVLGHGNFGSIDGDSAAAMRYTEAKLTPLAMELLKDLEKNTVHWSFNFDDTLKEPDMLPGGFPNLLVNGTSGIAVGVATNIPPHNLCEVVDGTLAFIDNRKITLDEMMKIIKGPDFPTGGVMLVGEELKLAYETGKGKVVLRAKVDIETDGDKQQLVITEVPYQTNKSALLQKIAELKDQHKDKLSVISEIRDESDRKGLRAVIKLKKEANAKAILDFLYKSTSLQTSVGINMVAIAGGKPKQLSLLEIIDYWVEYQREIVVRKAKYELDVAKDRAHIIEGLLVAIKNIDEVIKIIKKSPTVAVAKQTLREKFVLSERQAQAILDMRLARLVNLEVQKLEQELKELLELIENLNKLLASKKLQYNEVKSRLLYIKKQYKNPRRTQIGSLEKIKEEAIVPQHIAFEREVVVGISGAKTIKQIPVKNYSLAQKDNVGSVFDVHEILLKTMTSKELLMFTNKGNCFKILAEKLPEAKWKEKGVKLSEICKNSQDDEFVISIIENQNLEGKNLLFYSKNGYIKRTLATDCVIVKNFYSVFALKDDDELLNVEIETDHSGVVMVAESGMTLNFETREVPVQSRNAGGVMGINIDDGDKVIFASLTSTRGSITVITDNGYMKKVPIGEYTPMARYRKGLKIVSFVDNGKKLVYAKYSEQPEAVVTQKDEKLSYVGSRTISYDNRVSKGKQIHKGKITKVYTCMEWYEQKSTG